MGSTLFPGVVETGADIQGPYRYLLWRKWSDDGGRCLFVMLNPSTADASHDDPTIRRCIGFARRWGCGELRVANVYAWRATDPSELRPLGERKHGPENWTTLCQQAAKAKVVVAAWGAHVWPKDAERVGGLLAQYGPVMALGTTRGGQPRHPLYAKGDTTLVEWRSPHAR